tara:strand:- start:535 stop:1044 length:510 start_codon:yes stop_codon:yes gene_type:complete
MRRKFQPKPNLNKDLEGFSSIEMVIVLTCIGIIATITFPLLTRVLEMTEVLIAEKYLHSAVKQCQMGLINGENYPAYSLPPQFIDLGFISNRAFQFSYTGIEGECLSSSGGNILSSYRSTNNESTFTFGLSINLVTGEKNTEGDVPDFIDWWQGFYSPLIDEDDPLLLY